MPCDDIATGFEIQRAGLHTLIAGFLVWCSLLPNIVSGQGEPNEPAAEAAEDLATQKDPNQEQLPPEKNEKNNTEAEAVGPPPNSPLAKEPRGPDQILTAAQLTLEIARLDATKVYLKQLLQLSLEPAELSRLRRKFGPSLFLKMANLKELQPESTKLWEQTNAAFVQQATDPELIHQRILELQGETATREAAYVELRSAGIVVLPGVIHELYLTQDSELREWLERLLIGMGTPAISPLIGALQTDSTPVLLTTIRVLERIGDSSTAEHLWYYTQAPSQPEIVHAAAQKAINRLMTQRESNAERGKPSESKTSSAAENLRRQARAYYRGSPVEEPDLEGLVTLWKWSPDQKTIVSEKTQPQDAALQTALKFAQQALELAPQDREMQTVYLTGALEREVQDQDGIFVPQEGAGTAFETALQAGGENINRVLEIAMADRRIPAAVIACRVLARVGTPRQLQSSSGRNSALVQALNDPDPRIQYEAAQAIVQLKPESRFPQCARVNEVLGRALVSEPTSTWNGFIVDSDKDRAAAITGMARTLGAEAEWAATGREAFAASSVGTAPDFVLMHVNVSRWGLSETLANFRADARTARIPIVLYGPAHNSTLIEDYLVNIALDGQRKQEERLAALTELSVRVRSSGGQLSQGMLKKLGDLADTTQNARLKAGISDLLLSLAEPLPKGQEADRRVIGPQTEFRKKYHRELATDSRMFYIEEPQSSEDLKAQIQSFAEVLRDAGMGPAERQRQARLAAVTLAEISRSRLSLVFPIKPLEPVLLKASRNPEILFDVLTSLSSLPSIEVQNRLAEIGLDDSLEVNLRVKALETLNSQVNQTENGVRPETVRRLQEFLQEGSLDEKLRSATRTLMGSLQPMGPGLKTNSR